MRELAAGIVSTFKQFVRGLVSSTTVSWVGAGVFALLELVACSIYFNNRRLAEIDPRWLMSSPRDEYMPLSLALVRLRESKLTGVHVAYFGASQALRSLADVEDEDLSEDLTEHAGQPAYFHVLSANNERFEDMLGATDQLPPSFRGIVVLMVTDFKDDYRRYKTPESLARIREHIAFAQAPSLRPIWEESDYHPRSTGFFFFDHLGFFAARREVAMRLHPVPRIARSQGFVDVEKRTKGTAQLEAERELLDEDGVNRAKMQASQRAPMLMRSGDVIDKLIDNMKDRGIEVVILEAPVFPLRGEVYERRIARYRFDLAHLARTKGIRHMSFDDQLDLRDTDFQDKVHLATHSKRRRFQTLLMTRLGAIIRDDFPEGSGDEEGADAP